MEIPAWVTIPRGSTGKNLPLIVNIHGGPHLRGYSWAEWGRWPEAQFFASRGYVVLEPEPRGSRGFGREHYRSSFKQWGLTMQDDITDGAMHLVNEGIVDKKRMCLHGGRYGGYATLQGLVKNPDLWRCGSPFVAVAELFLLFEANSDTRMYSDYLETDAKRIIGDPKSDWLRNSSRPPRRAMPQRPKPRCLLAPPLRGLSTRARVAQPHAPSRSGRNARASLAPTQPGPEVCHALAGFAVAV